MRKMGSFGILVLVVAMAIVLLLVAKSWKEVAPTALDVSSGVEHVRDESGEYGALPDLQDARESTDAHAEEVQTALDAIE